MARALRTEGQTMVAHRTRIGAAFATLSAATLAVTVSAAAPGSAQTSAGQANPVALITGAKSINVTEERYDIKGTDLGIMWTDERNRVLAAFGDTFGAGWTGVDSGFARPAAIDWRSNTLARSSDRNPADGMSFDNYVTDRPGHAKELIPSLKREGVETTKIPTGGINIDGRNYLAYMSIRKFTEPGHWITNYSGVAYARHHGYVYAFGTPNGRFGDAHLARVPEDQLLDNSAYEYWTGHGWERGNSTSATPIVQGPVGELSVRFDKTLNSWEMMYLDESRKAIVLRLAPQPTGPWSAEIPVATATEYPDLYGGFLNPD